MLTLAVPLEFSRPLRAFWLVAPSYEKVPRQAVPAFLGFPEILFKMSFPFIAVSGFDHVLPPVWQFETCIGPRRHWFIPLIATAGIEPPESLREAFLGIAFSETLELPR